MLRVALAVVLALALASCARERVDVAESDASVVGAASELDAEPPSFGEGGADAFAAGCGDPPIIGRCEACPHGYVTLADGGGSCECCP